VPESSNALRFNKNKPKVTLALDAYHSLDGAAEVFEKGLEKYSRGNWQKGLLWTENMDSMMRHILAFNSGEDLDPESGLPHVDHITCNALMLAQNDRIHPQLDDRSIHAD